MKSVRITRPFGSWFPGDVAGFADDLDDKIVASGAGVLVSADPLEPIAEAASDPSAARRSRTTR